MNKVLRAAGIVLGILILIGVAAAWILPRVIDPNNYRDNIAALVKEKTGRELVIGGDIGWSVFPWLGVEIGDTRLSNAPGFGDEPFARVAGAQVRVKLLPLLRKELEMSTIVLDGLQVNLAKDRNGRSNWADLMPAEKAPAKAPMKTPETARAAPIAALAIGGVEIRDARLVWDDRSTGSRQEIEGFNLTVGAIQGGEPVDLALDFQTRSGKPVLVSQVRMTGQIAASESYRQISVRDLKLSADAQGDALPGGKLAGDMTAQLAVDLDKQTLDLKELIVRVLDLSLRGQAQGAGVGTDKPQFSGTLELAEFAPRALLESLGRTLPEMSDAGVLGKAGAEFAFKATGSSANLSNLKLHLDDTRVTGTAGVANFSAPAINFNLALDAIDVDRYLPPRKPDQVKAAPTPAEAAAGGAAALPVDTLRGLNLNGTLKIGKLKAYQMKSTDVSVTLTAKNGLVHVFPASAKMYQGSYNGDITLDVRGEDPRIAMNEKLAGVQAGPLLTDMLGEAKVTGTANLAVRLSAAGSDPTAMRRTMNGNASFAFNDGVVKGMDVLGEVRKAYAVVRGKPQTTVTNQTEFSALTGTATITNGLVNNPDLFGKSPLMQVQGNGTADLVSETLDYRVTTTLVDTLEGKGELTGRPIPVHITGTFDAPKVRVDVEQALKEEVKKQVEKKVQEKLDEQLKGGLKGLFGR